MNFEYQVGFLRRTVSILPALVQDLNDEQLRWKPESGNWSVLEIVGHLLAEERLDFPLRLRSTLADPSQPWPPYDPEGIVTTERYNEQELQRLLEQFLNERRQNIEWLDQLQSPDWELTYQHPSIGPLKAGDLFLSWVAHDQLHVRQIAKRCYELINQDAPEFQSGYAGRL